MSHPAKHVIGLSGSISPGIHSFTATVGAVLRRISRQRDQVAIYYTEGPDHEATELRSIEVVQTGNPSIHGGTYVDTLAADSEADVIHIYDLEVIP